MSRALLNLILVGTTLLVGCSKSASVVPAPAAAAPIAPVPLAPASPAPTSITADQEPKRVSPLATRRSIREDITNEAKRYSAPAAPRTVVNPADEPRWREWLKAALAVALEDTLEQRAQRESFWSSAARRAKARDDRAIHLFHSAAKFGTNHCLAVLGHAASTPHPRIAARVLAGVARLGTMPKATAKKAVGLVHALLEHPDERVQLEAAIVAGHLLQAHEDERLRAAVAERALTALHTDPSALKFASRSNSCLGNRFVMTPTTGAAQFVHTAARLRMNALIEPLLDVLFANYAELKRTEAPHSAQVQNDPGRAFLLSCVNEFTADLSPAQVKKLHDVLRYRFWASPGTRQGSLEAILVADVLFGLYEVAPDDLLIRYDTVLSERGNRGLVARRLAGLPPPGENWGR